MKFLVAANVLSEATRQSPSVEVIDWLRRHEADLAVDPIVLGELRFGVLLLPKGRRRAALEHWFVNTVKAIPCVTWTADTGLRWSGLLARLRRRGKAMPIKDSLIAASALEHDLTVVTRNVRDFTAAGVRIVDPFAVH
ncbi:MAG: PIN domain-containing protein [Archangium sp.]|nr:PIN domain-containing protein [Archangium sp.]